MKCLQLSVFLLPSLCILGQPVQTSCSTDSCCHGPPGPAGTPGSAGIPGMPGAPGPAGNPGIPGQHGVSGGKGDKGEGGAAGSKGETGQPGVTGPKGEAGGPGIKGDTGACTCSSPPKVAFSAKRTTNMVSSSYTVMAFDTVITNLGNAYVPSTGIFTAPAGGTFYFAMHCISQSSNHNSYIYLVKDGINIVKIAGHPSSGNPFEEMSNSAILTLNEGNKVWVSANGNFYGHPDHPHCTFSGYAIYA